MNDPCRKSLRERLFCLTRHSLVAGVVGTMAIADATGQTIAEYDAKFGLNFMDPAGVWEWTPHNITAGSTVPLAPDPGTGFNAWGVVDNSNPPNHPFYSRCMDEPLPTGACSIGPVRNLSVQLGWRYSAQFRFVSDPGTLASMGLSIWIDNRGYFVLFDLDGNNLRSTLFNDPNPDPTFVLTSGGVGALAYHDVALVYRPALGNVAFEFDGVVMGTTIGETAAQHDNALLWGNLSNSGRGQMNFHRVAFEILLPGDYNRDGVVGAADYTVWRNSLGTNLAAADGDANGAVNAADYNYWKTRFGQTSALVFGAGSGSLVPEPRGIIFSLVGSAGVFLAVRPRKFHAPFRRSACRT